MPQGLPASVPVHQLRVFLEGSHACIAGSAVAAEQYGFDESYDDIDIFCYSNSSMIAVAQHLMDHGFAFNDTHMSMVWDRWMAWDMNVGWKTNSMKLHGTLDPSTPPYTCNVVYKMFEKQPIRRLSDVLESFDFGVLAMGYDLIDDGEFHDMRSYFYPRATDFDRLQLLPERRRQWQQGRVTQYVGIRQAGRAVKYHRYGYDMELVIPDLISGYRIAASHHQGHFDQEKVVLGQIYDRLADHLEDGELDLIAAADKLLPQYRNVDLLLEALD